MKRKIKIEKAYNVVEQYNRLLNPAETVRDSLTTITYSREIALIKIVVEDDKVYLQSDPIDLGDGGDLIIKRLAELDMGNAVDILCRPFINTGGK